MYKSLLSFISRAGLAVVLTACGAGSGSEGDSTTAGVSSNPITISSEPASSAAAEIANRQTATSNEAVSSEAAVITPQNFSSLTESSEVALTGSSAESLAISIPPINSDITGTAQIAASVITPSRIEAENYTSMYGVQKESCTDDVGGGQNVGYIETGDWMDYNNVNLNVPLQSRYKVTYRVASLSGGGRLALKNLSSEITLNAVDVPKTNGWQTWIDVTQEITLSVGNYNFKIAAESGGFNINWFTLELIPDTTAPVQPTAAFDAQGKIISGVAEAGSVVTVKNANNAVTLGNVTANTTTGVYSLVLATALINKEAVNVTATDASGNVSIAATIIAPQLATSVVIQAENFTSMSGIQNESTTDVGGGQNVGYIETGDWMAYNNINFNVPTGGRYKITYRVASLSGGGRLGLKNLSSEITLNSVAVPKTNGWQTWVDVTQEITLSAGNYNFKVAAESGGFNINWFRLESIASGSSSASSVSSIMNPQSSSSRSSSPVSSSRSSSSSSRSSISSLSSRSSSLSSSSRSSSISSSSRSSVVASSSRSSTLSSSSRSSSVAPRAVTIQWSHPSERENGVYLELYEIAGYEIRVFNPTTSTTVSFGITGNSTTSYQLTNYVPEMTVEIAVYDTQGLYSQYVPINK